MRAASRQALAEAEQTLESLLGAAEADPTAVGSELDAFARLLSSEVSLRRALADASSSAQARSGLVGGLLEGKVSAPSLQALQAVVSQRWSSPRELVDGVRVLAATALLIGAERAGELATVESELFAIGRLLDNQPELETALGNRASTPAARQELMRAVLGDRVNEVARLLAEQAVAEPRRGGAQRSLDALVELAAARRERSVAHVATAVPLTEEQQAQLARKLDNIYGRPIALHIEVDPGVLGGVVIRVGDEVIDGSAAGQIRALRAQLGH
ncbi:MAG TPA: F0F1 ATP synthase subunit delta [Croceibacterium sp.]|nr:F0F1 ATP synthase subunit delta [Croceibacterium sp.]